MDSSNNVSLPIKHDAS
jgi:hypothetical protein